MNIINHSSSVALTSMSYKYYGLVSVALLLTGLWFVVWQWPQGKHMTFSQHVARHKSATIYYFFLFAATLPLLNIFFISWFVPHFQLSLWFTVFAVAASLLQIACTVIPELPGWRTAWHQALAGASALLLLPLPGMLACSSHVPTVGRLLAGFALLTMMGIVAFAIRANAKHTQNILVAQVVYFAAFFVPILFISYL